MAIEIKSGDIFTIDQLSQHLKVFAGPGAGKTHLLTENIKNIIRNDKKITNSQNRKVLCITYTNAAVDEIKKRLEGYSKNVEVFTIHGFIIEYIIKPYQTELKKHILNDFNVRINSKSMILSQVEGLGILHGHDKNEIFDYINKESNTNAELDYSKNTMSKVEIDILKYSESNVLELFKPDKIAEIHKIAIKKYIWGKAKKLSHDEILFFGYKMAVSNSTISYALRVQFPYIFVDEFQDTNPLQAMLIEHLGKKSTIIGIIGDIAQSIYSFQGAKPSKFKSFKIEEGNINKSNEYFIHGNRRSTANIVHMSNYIRQFDTLTQISIKEYDNTELRNEKEKIKVKFIAGENQRNSDLINNILNEGGVVLTRSWAAAFNYMNGISNEQKSILKQIYNSYYNTPIDIRAEISEHANVTWVRAFKFIFMLWEAYNMKSVSDILNALSLYIDVKVLISDSELNAGILIKISKIINSMFEKLTDNCFTVDVIGKFNKLLNLDENKIISSLFYSRYKSKNNHSSFSIVCFSEEDKDELKDKITKLEWKTAYMLFKDVFSKDSKYMTVHQAKGLEWEKVVVSLEPTKFDKTRFITMFTNPQILNETEQDEFTRMFFVACMMLYNNT